MQPPPTSYMFTVTLLWTSMLWMKLQLNSRELSVTFTIWWLISVCSIWMRISGTKLIFFLFFNSNRKSVSPRSISAEKDRNRCIVEFRVCVGFLRSFHPIFCSLINCKFLGNVIRLRALYSGVPCLQHSACLLYCWSSKVAVFCSSLMPCTSND